MEDAIQKAAKSRYGAENDIRCEIDTETGEAKLTRVLAVVDEVENDATQINLECANKRNPDAKGGDMIAETMPPLEFGRVAAQNAKQVIVQKVREAERDRQFSEYNDRTIDVINGTVKRVEYGNVIVDLGRAEGIIRRDEISRAENVRLGDRISAYIYEVRREQRGPQIFPQARSARVSCRCCSAPKFPKSMTASSRSSRWPAIQEAAPNRGYLEGFFHRPGRRLCRYARRPRSSRRQRAPSGKGRHHPVESGCSELHSQRACAR